VSKNKLVSIDDILYVLDEIFNISLHASDSLKTRINDLERYIRDNILKDDKQAENELKRILYKQIKNAKTESEREKLYDDYKNLD